MNDGNGALPAYAAADVKARLLGQGASGTIYAMVMPESEEAIQRVVDGCDVGELAEQTTHREGIDTLIDRRDQAWLGMFREPWTERQNDMHVEYFDRWTEWAAPVVSFDPTAFPFRYPTAGASQGIEKLLAESITRAYRDGMEPILHVFEGEYEGFAAYARGLHCTVRVHERSQWRSVVPTLEPGFFFVSQPSAIDGMVWDDFDDFCEMIDELQMGLVDVVPDLTYVGATAREWDVSMDHHCIRAFVISHSKPFGLYYHRVGGVFAREERPTLFGNVWFKNLTSIRIGIEMMKAHDVFELPRHYLAQQKEAILRIAQRLRLDGLAPADIMVMANAPVQNPGHALAMLERGCAAERIVRVCVTPEMTIGIDPALAPTTAAALDARQDDEDARIVEIRTPTYDASAGEKREFASRLEKAQTDGRAVRLIVDEDELRTGTSPSEATLEDLCDGSYASAAAQIVLQADCGMVRLLKGFAEPADDEALANGDPA